jgi:hypothetical protein
MSSPIHFNEHGLLPPGDYDMTFAELRESLLVHGDGGDPNWDIAWRLHLVSQCEEMVNQLWQIGITEIFLDGSFVEAKARPNDIDGYFVCDLLDLATGRLERELNALDPYKIWTWDPASRRAYRGYSKKQLPMWHQYRVELYPHVGQNFGAQDQQGNELQFPSAFRQHRATGEAKGIVKINRTKGATK